jgi:adenine-specific DNA-methyltransferase
MAKKNTTKQIEQYEHTGKERANNPHVGLVTPATDPDTGQKKTYRYDPHLDPQLQWAGKTEHTSFEVPTVSLHVHERIDPNTIIKTVKKEHDDGGQMSLFAEHKPLREAIDFYKHKEGWTNRLIAGDSLLVMNSLLEKEGMAGKVQMVYFDPPYGIKYGSNFQPFVNKRDVKDGKDEDLSAEPEMIKAFRDTWELGIHSYLTYLRDRLLLARELLSDSGSMFVQIGDENIHHVREIMDEIFGVNNFFSIITFKKTLPLGSSGLAGINDFILWYAKDKVKVKFNELYTEKPIGEGTGYTWVELENGERRKMTKEEKLTPGLLPKNSKVFFTSSLSSSGYTSTCMFDFEFEGKVFKCGAKSWRTTEDGIKKLIQKKRIMAPGNLPTFIQYHNDFPVQPIHNIWNDTHGATNLKYVVQTSTKVIQRCLMMTTDPGDLILDITCGSGTSAYVAEEYGRRWMTCDTSRVSITLAKQKLMSAIFDYYKLAHPNEGISSGFEYKTVPHVTLSQVANEEPFGYETLIDQPKIDNSKARITGPFTVEAVPAPSGGPYLVNGQGVEKAKSFDDLEQDDSGSDTSISRTGETLRQSEWRDELLRAGVRAKGGNIIQFSRVEPLRGTKYIQAEAETKEDIPKKVLVVFGPEHAPLEQRMVENAWQEARAFKPEMLLFCAFQFDEEAAKDIDELTPAIAGMQLLKAQMNADMLTDDLRKKRSSNESFWLVGQPDVKVHKLEKGKVQVEVMGFDYYNPKTGNVESGGKKNIAMWMLDTDYDNRSLFPSQVFFPMAGSGDGWDKLAKNLKAEIDEEKIENFKGTVSLEFEPGNSIAVKIIDDRGIESLRVIKM